MRLLPPVAAVTGAAVWLACAGDVDAWPEQALDTDEREIPGNALPTGPLVVADAWVMPVGHWTQLLWANLLALGPFLWARLIGHGPGAVGRLAWAAVRGASTAPEDLASKLNHLAPGARIHRNATVEGCVLGPRARVGAGAVVRGAVLGEDAVVEELALVEGAVIGARARVQRLAMAKFSLIEEEAAFAGIMQLGVVGRKATVKHGATLMDMALGQGVRVRAGGHLVPAPHGLCGVCVGDGATLASGVRVAPGRAIAPGLEVLLEPGTILTHVEPPLAATRVVVRGGRMEPA
jgi:carbonic anhydrase/acetyltransferase-like protein (isoleucine patch superfamily)